MNKDGAFAQGYRAECNGADVSACPIMARSLQQAWRRGFRTSRRETFNPGKGYRYAGAHDYVGKPAI